MSGESTITNSLLFEREKGQVGPKSPRVNYPDHQLAIFYKKKNNTVEPRGSYQSQIYIEIKIVVYCK